LILSYLEINHNSNCSWQQSCSMTRNIAIATRWQTWLSRNNSSLGDWNVPCHCASFPCNNCGHLALLAMASGIGQ